MRIGGKPDQMVAQAKELAEQHPDNLGLFRNLYVCQGFHGQQIGKIISRTRQIVHPRQIGNKLVPGLAFANFFHPPMVIADIHVQAGDFLTV